MNAPQQIDTASTGVKDVRARNQAETRRASAIDCVMDHLEVIKALTTASEFTEATRRRQRRRQAAMIVDAILALTKGEQP